MYFRKINFHGCHWLRKYFYNGNFQIYGIILFHLSIIMICTVDEGEGWWCEWPHSPTLPPKDHPGQNQLCKYPLLLPRWVNSCMYTTVCMFRLILPQAFPSFRWYAQKSRKACLGIKNICMQQHHIWKLSSLEGIKSDNRMSSLGHHTISYM